MEKTEYSNLNIYCILHDVLKEIGTVLAIAVSAALLSDVCASFFYHPTYTSSTTLVVSAKGGTNATNANINQAQKLSESFGKVINSQVLKKRVSESLGESFFEGEIKISPVPESNLLTLSVTSDRPEMSFRLLKGLLQEYPEIGKEVFGNIVLEILEKPSYPSVADQPKNFNGIMKKSFLIAFAGMIIVLIINSYLKDTIKKEQDVTKKLDTKLFGVIGHENSYRNFKSFLERKKKRLLLTDPAVSFSFDENMKKICTHLMYDMKKKNAKVLLITSAKGKEGKTTISMNLAQAMSQHAQKVLLIEGDLLKGNLNKCMHMEKQIFPDWGSYFKNKNSIDEFIVKPDGMGFYAMFNNKKLTNITEKFASEEMKGLMGYLKQEMDVIIIDAPMVYKRSDTEVLARLSDLSLLVVKQNETESKYINDAIDMLKGYGQGLSGCIFNDVYSKEEVLAYGNYSYGYGYGYGKYGKYGMYGSYGAYGKYGKYGKYYKDNRRIEISKEKNDHE